MSSGSAMKAAENHHDVCPETHRRLRDLFHKLDVDGDGRIDVKDLTAGLQKLGLPHSTDNAKKFIESSDLTRDGVVDFQEFAQYVLEHERNLKLVFNKIDENADGHIDEEVGSVQRKKKFLVPRRFQSCGPRDSHVHPVRIGTPPLYWLFVFAFGGDFRGQYSMTEHTVP